MTLEERYKQAAETTYVGRVKKFQTDGKAGEGVNFMDGDRPSAGAPDTVQKEFTKNATGDFLYGGGGKVAGTYKLSRWLNKGIEKGDAYVNNSRFNSFKGVTIHKYNWLSERQSFVGGLKDPSKGRVNGSASGPSPRGVNG